MTATVRRLPAAVARWLRDSPLTQDALISNMEYVLGERAGGLVTWRRSTDIDRTTGAPSRRYTGASSATMPPRRAGCDGNGSIAAIRTTPGGSRRSGSRAKGPRIIGQYATMPVRLSLGGARCRDRGAWT